jgi:pimeloyl-ACP methyl ester carboxylesterase
VTLPGGVVAHLERFEHGGGTLVDETFGDSQARHMLFLHGWGANRENLRGVAVLFQHQYQIHLIDLPGFGDTPVPPTDWGTPNYTDLVQQYIASRIAGPMILVGHSFGGRVALRLGARHLPWVRGIVLMGTPGLPAEGFSYRMVRRWAIRTLRRFLTIARPFLGQAPLDWHTRRFGSRDYLAAGELRPILVRTVNEDLTECARTVGSPVLLLYGGEDTETPPALAFRYKALMDGRATVEVLPHKDHYLATGTGAHLCAFKIRNWLRQQGQA